MDRLLLQQCRGRWLGLHLQFLLHLVGPESIAMATRVTNVLLFAGFDLAAVPPRPLYINSHPDRELREEEEEVPSDREGTERH